MTTSSADSSTRLFAVEEHINYDGKSCIFFSLEKDKAFDEINRIIIEENNLYSDGYSVEEYELDKINTWSDSKTHYFISKKEILSMRDSLKSIRGV